MNPKIRLHRAVFPLWVILLAVLMLAGLVAGITVFINGLVVTNLTDLVPWGLWIGIDLSAIALSAGAFTLSAAVYLFGWKKLQPLARTAVFIGFLGYSMAMLCLLMDIGRPDRFWHAIVFWNIHSPLWEVTMCVVLYFTVLLLEVLPIFGNAGWFKARWPSLSHRLHNLHKFAPILAIFGLGFSLLHQSSLGATYGVLKARPIWYKPSLAILFIVSAVIGGLALTVLASKLAALFSERANVRDDILDKVSQVIGWMLFGYLYLRFWDTLGMEYTLEPGRTEGLHILTSGALAFNFWLGELLLGILIPAVILVSGRLRRQPRLHLLALAFTVGGLVAYRWDINIVGQLVAFTVLPTQIEPLYTAYRPAMVEILVGLGVIAYGLLGFTLGARYLGIVDHSSLPETAVEPAIVKPVPLPTD
ncbi:NrfD/PsrC family molybdoenzyme membrane anchor subunit [Candidatus Leptofilum sp.]|uniref:NrfD/PsrC family molybdoenzyme membrane anchor subunit n=1 Tax=Candidatus Leptofilum sp. TaxID=3241576 RepID=UPI003B5CF990